VNNKIQTAVSTTPPPPLEFPILSRSDLYDDKTFLFDYIRYRCSLTYVYAVLSCTRHDIDIEVVPISD
jgi:hypothetical protein